MIVYIHPEAAAELSEAALFYVERSSKELGPREEGNGPRRLIFWA